MIKMNHIRKGVLVVVMVFTAIFCQTVLIKENIKLSLKSNWNYNPYYNYDHYIGTLKLQDDLWQVEFEPIIIDSIVGKQVLGSEF